MTSVAVLRRLRRTLAFVAAMTLAPAGVWAADDAPPPVNGHFNLETLDGKEVSNKDYQGKWLLIYFGYTFCPDVCPTTLSQIGAAFDALGPKVKDFQAVFITLDPARDKAPVMKDYMKSFNTRIA